MVRKITHKRYDIAFGLFLAVTFGFNVRAAKSAELTITRGVTTVLGIQQGTPPVDAYRSKPTVNVRPTAGIHHVLSEAGAPPNGCPEPAFRVISGPKAERGCFGAMR